MINQKYTVAEIKEMAVDFMLPSFEDAGFVRSDAEFFFDNVETVELEQVEKLLGPRQTAVFVKMAKTAAARE